MPDIATIRGSWGDLRVDRATGCILTYTETPGMGEDELGYHDILYIMPETLAPGRDACLDKHGETDILCVGFVDAAGRVTTPMVIGSDGLFVDPFGLLPAPETVR